jgi:hypothetical protein
VVDDQRGQASVELVAILPLVAVLTVVLWQLAVAGYGYWATGGAARAAARAEAVGGDADAAARRALSDPFERGLKVRPGRDGEVSVRVGVPLVVGGGSLLHVESRARLPPQGR